MTKLLRKVSGIIPALIRKARSSIYKIRYRLSKHAPDFVGFDKYMVMGAYHWNEIQTSFHYKQKAEFFASASANATLVVDFGCGDAAMIGFSAEKNNNTEFIGIEADKAACRLANQQLKKAGIKNAKVINESFSAVDVASIGSADVVVSMDVIEHLPDPVFLLAEMKRCLREGGMAYIGTPLYINDALISPYHTKEFTLEEFQATVSSYFTIQEVVLLPELRLDGIVYEDNYCILRVKNLA